jgi:hypothetical protein
LLKIIEELLYLEIRLFRIIKDLPVPTKRATFHFNQGQIMQYIVTYATSMYWYVTKISSET